RGVCYNMHKTISLFLCMTMYCQYFKYDECRSCQWLNDAYLTQLAKKSKLLTDLFQSIEVKQWLPPQKSASVGSRNKAKMVVSGSSQQPILGIINHHHQAVDLCRCPLYPASITAIFDDV